MATDVVFGNPLSDSSVTISLNDYVKMKSITTIPKQYVRTDKDSAPPAVPSPISTPVIDMARLTSDGEDAHLELQKLDAACKEWGLFQVVNHGVTPSLLEKLKHEMEAFNKLPLEEKMKFRIMSTTGNHEGYGNTREADAEHLDWVDKLYIKMYPVNKRNPRLLPLLPSAFSNTLDYYSQAMQTLATQILICMGKALKVDPKELRQLYEDATQSVRMAYYPPCPQPELVNGISPHSDATLLTILHQVSPVEGFEIKKDGVWSPITFLPDALIVNLGDILEIFSNGVYYSMEHRAVPNSDKERMTIAFFTFPKVEVELGPTPSLVSPERPPQFRRVTMAEYYEVFFTHKFKSKEYLEYYRVNNNPTENGDES